MPKFSVIIPVYNAERYLREALDSVLAQTYADWECVCVDDGSTDGSGAILDEYAVRDARFRVIHQSNAGVATARNVGLAAAGGEWIGWLDADDVYAPCRLEEVVRLIGCVHPDLVRLTNRMESMMPSDFNSIRLGGNEYHVLGSPLAIARWGWDVLLEVGMTWNWYARKEILSGLLFRTDLRIKEDSIFSVSFIPRLKKVCHEMHDSLFYRVRPDSAIHSTRKLDDTCHYLNALRDVWNEQKAFAEANGTREIVRARFRSVAERDIIDLVYWGECLSVAEWRQVKEAYDALKAVGAFSETWQIPQRYRLCIPLYYKFGWTKPIWWTEAICRSMGHVLRFLKLRK